MLTSTFDYEEHQQQRHASEIVEAQVVADRSSGIEAAAIARQRCDDNYYL